MDYKKFTIQKHEQGYLVLSPNGWDICGEYLPSLKLAKSVVNDYINDGGLDGDALLGASDYKLFIDSLTNKTI